MIILGLIALDVMLPATDIGRRGHEALARADIGGARSGRSAKKLPDLAFQDLRGESVSLNDMRGHATLLIFERSVDW